MRGTVVEPRFFKTTRMHIESMHYPDPRSLLANIEHDRVARGLVLFFLRVYSVHSG